MLIAFITLSMVFVLVWTIGDTSSVSCQSLYQIHSICSMSSDIICTAIVVNFFPLMYKVILETKWNLRLERQFPGFRNFCYVRKNFITPCNRITDLESSICCCPWLTGHSRKLLRGFPDCLCEVSHCSPLTDGRQSILYIGLPKIPEHVYGSHCSSNWSSISGFVWSVLWHLGSSSSCFWFCWFVAAMLW